jgi:hypothetical protein
LQLCCGETGGLENRIARRAELPAETTVYDETGLGRDLT